MKLIAQWTRVESEIGYSLRERFLMPVRSFDNSKAVSPFLLEHGNRRYLLCVHVEKGNASALALPPSITPLYYRPYFSFQADEQPPRAVASTLADAIERVGDAATPIVVDGAMPLAVVQQLRQRFRVEPEPAAPLHGSVSLRRAKPAQISSGLATWRPEAGRFARKLMEQSPHSQRIGDYLEGATEDRFGSLDAALGHAGLDMLVLTSDLNMQEVGGVPLKSFPRPLAVIYRPGGEVWIMEPGLRQGANSHASPAQALKSLGRAAPVGVEGEDMGWAFATELQLADDRVTFADQVLRAWRDHSTLPDLAFYIVSTRASLLAIEAALAYAADAVRLRWAATEMDAYAVYLKTLHEMVAARLPQLRVHRTLTNFHSGARTIFPAMPAPFPLTKDSNTLKIDAGCLLFDPAGRLLGCSDIARTLVFSEAGRSLYEGFRDAVRYKLIPACKPGARGRDIHATACDQVWGSAAGAMANDPLYVKLDDTKKYDRDVGHLLGKNNLAHLTFTSGADGTLSEGMIACCEYQWPLAGHAVAYEDTCLVTPEGGINLTCETW